MSKKKDLAVLTAGILIGAALVPAANAAVQQLTATPSAQTIYVDGKSVELSAYIINDSNYVKLRDVGKAVGFNVYWDGSAVQIESDAPYTGTAPAQSTTDTRGLTYNSDGSINVPTDGFPVRAASYISALLLWVLRLAVLQDIS